MSDRYVMALGNFKVTYKAATSDRIFGTKNVCHLKFTESIKTITGDG